MAKKADEAGKKEKGKKGKGALLLPLIIGAAAFFAGGKFMGGSKTVVAGPPTTTTIPPGAIITLDPITMNLADGRLLKVGVALQLAPGDAHGAAEGGGHGAPAKKDEGDDPTKGYAQALDLVIRVLGEKTFDELIDGEERAVAKAELVERLHHAYHGEIEDIYFHQFVMQ